MNEFDWMTWSVEGVGILILCVWVIVPIREFRVIFRRLLLRPRGRQPKDAGLDVLDSRRMDVGGRQTAVPLGREPLHPEPLPAEPVAVES